LAITHPPGTVLQVAKPGDFAACPHDVSGFGKVAWVILLIVLPYIGIFAYLLTQGGGMAERNREQAERAQDQLRRAVGFSPADEIEKLDRLKASKSITEQEYARLRDRLVR
jgi:carboxylesterase type B